jgi:hypothetical protein
MYYVYLRLRGYVAYGVLPVWVALLYTAVEAYFALKGIRTKRSATRVRNNPPKKHEAKGDAPGLKSSDVSLVTIVGRKGPTRHYPK